MRPRPTPYPWLVTISVSWSVLGEPGLSCAVRGASGLSWAALGFLALSWPVLALSWPVLGYCGEHPRAPKSRPRTAREQPRAAQRCAQEASKTLPRRPEQMHDLSPRFPLSNTHRRFQVKPRFFSILGPNVDSCRHTKFTKRRKRGSVRGCRKSAQFSRSFWSASGALLGGNLAPSWCPGRLKTAPKSRPRRPPRRSWEHSKAHRAPNTLRTPQHEHMFKDFGKIFTDFTFALTVISQACGTLLSACLTHAWLRLGDEGSLNR